MAGRFRAVAFAAALVCPGLIGMSCFAQESPASPAPSADTSPVPDKPFKNPEARKLFESLTPEQQQKVRENYQRWLNMTPEEKKALREREQLRRQKILQEIDGAIKQSGLQLDDQTRNQYIMRYTQERRVIEQRLQQEMEEKRRPQLQDLINRLKAEFQDRSSPASSASPSPATQSTAAPSI